MRCSNARFTTPAGKASIQRVLLAYAAFDPEVNYCQGMNFLAALLLIWMPSEAEAFGGLVVLMQERGLRELYKTDMASLQVVLTFSTCSLSCLLKLLLAIQVNHSNCQYLDLCVVSLPVLAR